MSYRLSAITKYGSFTDWFMNAIQAAFQQEPQGRYLRYSDAFQIYYGLPVHTHEDEKPTRDTTWEVEFPSEGDAILFVLRWS